MGLYRKLDKQIDKIYEVSINIFLFIEVFPINIYK